MGYHSNMSIEITEEGRGPRSRNYEKPADKTICLLCGRLVPYAQAVTDGWLIDSPGYVGECDQCREENA